MEIASNDGYLLQHFVARRRSRAGHRARRKCREGRDEKGIPTTVKFFGQETARSDRRQHGKADLLLGNNVLAHVPDLNDFVRA